MGLVSTLGALPEITAPISENLSNQINNRTAWIERIINSKIDWTQQNRGAFMGAYKELVSYGLPS